MLSSSQQTTNPALATNQPVASSGYAVRVSLIAALGGFLFGFETAVISGAEKIIQQLWSLSSFWQGFTVASSLIGTVISSLIAGMPAQNMAEKKCWRLLPSCICFPPLVVQPHLYGCCLFRLGLLVVWR